MNKSLVLSVLAFSGALGRGLFGTLSGYNLVALNKENSLSCAYSDVRGRVASRGNTVLQNYDIGCSAFWDTNEALNDQCAQSWSCSARSFGTESVNYWGLIAGDDTHTFSFKSGNIAGGIARGQTTALQQVGLMNDCNTAFQATSTAPINWDQVTSEIFATSSMLKSRAATGTYTLQYGSTLTLVGTGADVETFNVAGADLSAATTVYTSGLKNGATVFVNVNGTSITIQGGKDQLKSISTKLVWNFYEATSISLATIYGAVLAPYAAIRNFDAVAWGQLFVDSLVSSSANFNTPSHCGQINWIPYTGFVPPSDGICGDGNVDSGEQCDLGAANNGAPSSCCNYDCTFASSSTICRDVAGECDVAEKCTGSSAICPVDQFLPAATPCSHNFGICNVQLNQHCPGNGAQCITEAPQPFYQWDAFNVISFNTYTVYGGDVEGAIAVKNQLNVSSFDAGLRLTNADAYTPYTVLVAGDAVYESGEVHPDAGSAYETTDIRGQPISFPWGYIGLGTDSDFNAPSYLQSSVIRGLVDGAAFDAAQDYYQRIQALLAGLETNAEASVIYGDGLLLTCDRSDDALYHVQVAGSDLSKTNWYIPHNCSLTAGWVIDVLGNSDITIKGGAFPAVVEKVIYNVLGSGRTIFANNGVNANILAPNNFFYQSQGVTYGRLIVGDVIQARQNNKPNCTDFSDIVITNRNLQVVNLGQTWIYVVDLASYAVGDSLCFGNDCPLILNLVVENQPVAVKRGASKSSYKINVSRGYGSAIPAGSTFTTVANPNVERTSVPVSVVDVPATSAETSNGVIVGFSMFFAVLALLF